jgi:hypothetical protein
MGEMQNLGDIDYVHLRQFPELDVVFSQVNI